MSKSNTSHTFRFHIIVYSCKVDILISQNIPLLLAISGDGLQNGVDRTAFTNFFIFLDSNTMCAIFTCKLYQLKTNHLELVSLPNQQKCHHLHFLQKPKV